MSSVLIQQYLAELARLRQVADYKDKVIDMLMRVTRVSAETQAIVEAMRAFPR
jgi:hypothetical protein